MNPGTLDPSQNAPALVPCETHPPDDRHDQVEATAARAEAALTLDGLSLTVDGVIFWHAAAAALRHSRQTMGRVAQVCLCDAVRRSTLVELLDQRPVVEERLRQEVEAATAGSGSSIRAISIAHVAIPAALDAAFEARTLGAIGACLQQHAGRGDAPRTNMAPLGHWHGLLSVKRSLARHSRR
jgi:regulator of protease activity HflC (stomatin/prohibitin superfamily)